MITCYNGFPASVQAGTQVTFYPSGKYSAEEYTLKVALNNGVDAPAIVDGVPSGYGFTVVLAAPAKQGVYNWSELYTLIADNTKKYSGRSGTLTVTPSPFVAAVPTFAQEMVTKLRAAASARATSSRGSISFNGQSVSWNSPQELNESLVYWESRVIKEQRDLAALHGGEDISLVRPVFLSPNSCG